MAQRPHGQRPTTAMGEGGKRHNRAQPLLTWQTIGKLALASERTPKAAASGRRQCSSSVFLSTYFADTRRQTGSKQTVEGSRTHYESAGNKGKEDQKRGHQSARLSLCPLSNS
eukprot:GHVU01127137.1.p1 GENE.GHVU01127137.1~~GHVU01127137.1.p1  ORF type:complete len:113 (-),score=9.01 GHVU01127137.1:181-519(-)